MCVIFDFHQNSPLEASMNASRIDFCCACLFTFIIFISRGLEIQMFHIVMCMHVQVFNCFRCPSFSCFSIWFRIGP